MIIFISFAPPARAAWLSGWQYRKSIAVNSASNAGSGYQKLVKVYYGSGTDGTETVYGIEAKKIYLNSHARTDFGDVRFTAADQTTLLDHWLWEKVDSSYALFWVKISADISSSGTTIYIYYGKSDATSASNGPNTFLLFDDFLGTTLDTSKWTAQGSVAVANGYAQVTGSGSWNTNGFYSNSAFDRTSYGYRIMMCAKVPITTMDAMLGYGPGPINYQDGIYLYFEGTNNFYRWHDNVGLNFNTAYAANTEYRLEIRLKKGTGYRLLIDGTQKEDDTTFADNNHRVAFNNYENAQILYINYVFVGKYVDPEPTWGASGAEEVANQAPTNVSLTLDLSGASYKGTKTLLAAKQYYKFVYKCSDADGVTDIVYAQIQLDPSGKNVILRATRGSGDTWTFSEYSDPNDYVTLDTSGSSHSTSGNEKTFNFMVMINWNWGDSAETITVRAYVIDSQSASDQDDYANVFGVEAHLTVASAAPSQSEYQIDQAITVSGYIYYTGTSIPPPDGNYNVQAYRGGSTLKGSDTSLVGGQYSISFSESPAGSYFYRIQCDRMEAGGYRDTGTVKVKAKLNLRALQWDQATPLAGATVYMNNGTEYSLAVSGGGWANFTGIYTTPVTIKVKWEDSWVNGSFSVAMDAHKTLNARCKVYANYGLNFKFNDGSTGFAPSSVSIQAPNGTVVSLSSPYTIPKLQNGTWTVKAINYWGGNVKPATDPTFSPTDDGQSSSITCRIYSITISASTFRDSGGSALYVEPSAFSFATPNSTYVTAYGTYWIQNGTCVWQSVTWQGTNVAPSSATFDASNGSPTLNCLIYSLQINPAWKDAGGTALYANPSQYTVQLPNGTARQLTSNPSWSQVQTGTITITSVIWQGTEVVPTPNPSTSLTSNLNWQPSINCKVYSLTLSFKDNSGGSLSIANYTITFPNSTQASGRTALSYSQIQTGTITLNAVYFQNIDVKPASNTYGLTASGTWTVTCKVYKLTVVVKWGNGTPISGAAVTVYRNNVNLNGLYGLPSSPTTNSTGHYCWPQMAHSTAYNISASHNGFSSSTGTKTLDSDVTTANAWEILMGYTYTFTVSMGSGWLITVDGVNYTTPKSFCWQEGEQHSFAAVSPQAANSSCRFIFTAWSDGSASQSRSLIVTAESKTFTANYKVQWLLTVQSDGLPSVNYRATVSINGSSQGQLWDSGPLAIWLDAGKPQGLGVSAIVPGPTGSEYRFDHWTNDASTSNPRTITLFGAATYKAKYLTFGAAGLQVVLNSMKEVQAGQGYGITIMTNDGSGYPIDVDSVRVTLIDASGNLIAQNVTASRISVGRYAYSYATSSSSAQGNWLTRVHVTYGSRNAYNEVYWRLVGGPFDVYVIITNASSPISKAEITAENKGSVGQDVTIEWTARNLATGTQVDAGSFTIFVPAGSQASREIDVDIASAGQYRLSVILWYSGTERAGSYADFTVGQPTAPSGGGIPPSPAQLQIPVVAFIPSPPPGLEWLGWAGLAVAFVGLCLVGLGWRDEERLLIAFGLAFMALGIAFFFAFLPALPKPF
ncbi:MAG: DUF2341 domain-containing protein [Candidatus Bathyarchaeia archaeon]